MSSAVKLNETWWIKFSVYFPGCKTPISNDHNKKFGVPSMEDIGKDVSKCGPLLFEGGESEGLKRMERYLKQTVRASVLVCVWCFF